MLKFEHIKKGSIEKFIELYALIKIKNEEQGIRYPILKLKSDTKNLEELFTDAKNKTTEVFMSDKSIENISYDRSEYEDSITYVAFKKFIVQFKVNIPGLDEKIRIEPLSRLKMSINGKNEVIEQAKKNWLQRSKNARLLGLISEYDFYCTDILWLSEEEDFEQKKCDINKKFEEDLYSDIHEIIDLKGMEETMKLGKIIYGLV